MGDGGPGSQRGREDHLAADGVGLVKQQSGTVSYDGVRLTASASRTSSVWHLPCPRRPGGDRGAHCRREPRLGPVAFRPPGTSVPVCTRPTSFSRRWPSAGIGWLDPLGRRAPTLAIGRALSPKPNLCCWTNPLSDWALWSPPNSWPYPRKLARETRLTVVLVEQNVRSALSIAEEAVVINLGRVVIADRADTVAADTQLRHHYLGF